MATNPPITIGELVDVPAPGSGVKSAWCQEVTRRAAHRFTTAAARDAAYPAAAAGGGALAYTADTKTLWLSDGAAWLPVNTTPPTPWVNVTFQNGWVNRATGQVVQYRKEGDIVRVRGHCQNGTAPPSVIFTLPPGFRPPASENLFATITGSGNNALGVIYVDGGGSVYAYVGNNGAFELNFSFSVSAT